MSAEKLQSAVTAFCLLRAGCSKGLTKTTFDADVAPAFTHRMSARELKLAYETARTVLARNNLTTRRPRGRVALELTNEGCERASALIGLTAWVAEENWAKVVSPRLIGILAEKNTSKGIKEILTADGLRRAILEVKEGKQLRTKRLTEEMQHRVAAYVGSKSRDIRAVRKAILQRAAEQITEHPPSWLARLGAPPPTSLPAFAAAVKQMARDTKTGRIGPSLVFISHVYDTVQKQYPEWDISMDQFKARLKEAALADLVDLAVANIMEPEWMPDLRRSRIDDGVRCWDVVRLAVL